MSFNTSFIFHQLRHLTWSKQKTMVKIEIRNCVRTHMGYSLQVRESSFIDNIIFHVVVLIALFCFWTSFCLEVCI